MYFDVELIRLLLFTAVKANHISVAVTLLLYISEFIQAVFNLLI